MRIDGNIPYAWDKVNEAIKRMLLCECDVQVYKGTAHALFEVCLGLHLRFSHKRKIIAKTGWGSHLRNTQLEMARLGVRFKDSFEEDMAKEAKASLAYISDWDDALTGKVYSQQETLDKIGELSLFRVHILHHLFYFDKTFLDSVGDYDIFVCSLSKDIAIVFSGAKCKLPQLSSGELYWGQEHIDRTRRLIATEVQYDKDKVLEFEKQLPEGAKPWFVGDQSRIFDRSVICLQGYDGSAFVDLFNETYGLEPTTPGDFNPLDTTSFNRWRNRLWLDQASELSRSPADIRGLVSFSCDFITDDLPAKVEKILSELDKLSH